MASDTPMADSASDRLIDLEDVAGVDLLVHGDESRKQLARRIIAHRQAITVKAVQFLEAFIRDRGAYDLYALEVFANRTAKDGDFALRLSLTADQDPDLYIYMYFEVHFIDNEPPQEPFWPCKLVVGFQ